ncbi:hypothetical protein Tco_1057644 [Tanacetum coccineum]|uniref:Reverse transcriptase domain-containing protein n=1 Tax=Tanacetum coccineum TaxID=301880 RepID=A0ABQ5H7R9_9ASTR
MDVKGAPECMQISGFMHGITNPELIKRLHDKILKTVDEMMKAVALNKGAQTEQWKGTAQSLAVLKWRDNMANRANTTTGKDWRRRTLRFGLDEFCGCKVTISVQRNYWKTGSQKIASSSVNSLRNVKRPPGYKTFVEKGLNGGYNPEYPKQTVMIGSTLTEEGRNKLRGLLQRNLDIFSWKPADMTDVPRHIAEHRLNVREGCSPVRQKKRGQAADRNQAIQEEVKKLVEA